MLKKLWSDEVGAIVSAEIVLVATILVIGMIVGLKSVRDAVVTELADVAQAIAQLDQTYSFSGVNGHAAGTAGSVFNDAQDFCDSLANDDAIPTSASKCVIVAAAANVGETGVVP